MKLPTVSLAALSGGSPLRAATVLVVSHLIPGVVACGLWAFGLLPIFDDLRWIPVSIAVAFGVGSTLWMLLSFGFWGSARTMGRGHGEEYEETFSPGAGFALGWLRWFLQVVMVAVVLLPVLMTWMNVRWWQLAGNDELDALPDRAAAIPAGQDWELTAVDASETGLLAFMSSTVSGPEPEGYVEQTFAVPDTFVFPDVREWLEGPDWAQPVDGSPAFGEIRVESCRTESARCDARLVPSEGAEPEYFIRAQLRDVATLGGGPELEVRLTYRASAEPDYDVSPETVERAESIPVPADWIRIDVLDSTTVNGETISQWFGVPTSFDRADLESWLHDSVWTEPASGEPFGQLDVDSCRETGTAGATRYLCSAMVAGTERAPGVEAAGPIESLTVSLASDHTVRVSLARNG